MRNAMLAIIVFLVLYLPVQAMESEYGSTMATVVSIYDGDTLTVDISGWPPVIGDGISVRVGGIDTPELKDKRDEVRALAYDARSLVVQWCEVGSRVELRRIRRDKYFRILADVWCQGRSIAAELVANGLARPYNGGTKEAW
jgi:endonuclease YncB( thermonuclease family)